jgi:hypothetical protein
MLNQNANDLETPNRVISGVWYKAVKIVQKWGLNKKRHDLAAEAGQETSRGRQFNSNFTYIPELT